MPKKVGRFTIEQWRDGECIARITKDNLVIEHGKDACRVIFPPGGLTLGSGDELHFDAAGLIDWLTEVQSCPETD
jgi:hypothetical protein